MNSSGDRVWAPSRDELQLRLKQLYYFIDMHRVICEAHSVDFYLHDNWNKCMPSRWREEIGAIQDETWFINPPKALCGEETKGSFSHFLHEAKRLRLPLTSGTVPQSNALSKCTSFAMSAKKSHEVEKFSQFVSDSILTQAQHIHQVLDVGSGKGYLSECLAQSSGVTVVGLDSQDSNTQGALRRRDKVLKEQRKKNVGSRVTANEHSVSDFSKNDISLTDEDLSISRLFHASNEPNAGSLSPWCSPPSSSKMHTNSHGLNQAYILNKLSPESNQACDINTDSSVLSKITLTNVTHVPNENYQTSAAVLLSSFVPITLKISNSDYNSLLPEVEHLSQEKFNSKDSFCIVGLHACGDLTSSALRLFSSMPMAAAVCVVGCCYHHITEGGGSAGFPLSSYFQSTGAYLGRTTRMLACQTLARLSDTTSGNALIRIHWRSMLQVLLSRKYPGLFENGQEAELVVGRCKKPVRSFEEYCKLSLERLKLDPSNIRPADIESMEEEYSLRVAHLQNFMRVRVVLAACIESTIILDRLLFLLEQEFSMMAGLVQLFDPATSPRCHALVALRK